MSVRTVAAPSTVPSLGTFGPASFPAVPFGIGDFVRAMLEACPDAMAIVTLDPSAWSPSANIRNEAMNALLEKIGSETLLSPPDPWPSIVARLCAGESRVTLRSCTPGPADAGNAIEHTITMIAGTQGVSHHLVVTLKDRTDEAKALRNITYMHELEAERERMLADALDRADRDPLTGLLNHRAFHTRLSETAAEFRISNLPYTVLMMDLDNFKFFNDAYGHRAGDEVLRKVSRIIRGVCRSDDALARLGGDEFALVLPGASGANAENFLERLQIAMKDVGYRPPEYEWEVPLSLSAAYAVCPLDAHGKHDVIAAAEERLAAAKYGQSDSAHIVTQLRADLSGSYESFSMLNALVSAVDNKDRYTRQHSEDVLKYSVQIAEELGLDDRTVFHVKLAALLHDVGKIGVPDDILRKPGKLTDEEFAAVKQHPAMGAVMVKAVPGFESTLDAVRYHHERWDGGGYPTGLSGKDIPLLGRLMAVADAFSAMTTDRPYRKAMDDGRALGILRAGAGSQWDPDCVEAFLRAHDRGTKSMTA